MSYYDFSDFNRSMLHNRLHTIYYGARVKLSGPEAFPLHDHDFGEVCWLDEGSSLVHRVNGQDTEMQNGSFIFIRPTDCHSFHCKDDKPVFVINICFQWHLFEGLKQRYFPGNPNVYGEDLRLPKMLQLKDEQIQTARNAFIGLLKAPETVMSIERFLINLFAELAPCHEEDILAHAPQWMRNAWNLIRQPDYLRLGVREFYRLCGRCPEHVSREFQKQTGQTIAYTIAHLRMVHAAAQLTGTTHEIIDVSRDCGFESLSHFYVCFRKAYGVTPREYRKKAQGRMYVSDSI